MRSARAELAECRLAPVDADFRPCSGPGSTDTPAAALGDGAYTFSVRSAGGFLVIRSFTVDTVAFAPRGFSSLAAALGSIRRALRAGRTVSLRLSLRAEDVAGNARTSTRSVRVTGS